MAKSKKGGMSAENKKFFKDTKAAGDAFLQANAKGKGTAKIAGPDGPTAQLEGSIALGYGFDIDSVSFMATDQAYFHIAAQLTLAVRPAFRKAVVQLRKIIPGMVKEKLDNSKVVQDLRTQESLLVAALGLADSSSSASDLVNHIVKSIRVRITTDTVVAGASEFQVPQIIWGIAENKLMSVGSWGSYASYPSRDSINWAMWLLSNGHKKSGHRIKFGSFSGRQSRTRNAIMLPGGSFDLSGYIDPYEVNFVEDIIDENLSVSVDRIAGKIITEEVAKIPNIDIGRTAGLLQARAGNQNLVSLSTGAGEGEEAKSTTEDALFGATKDQIETLKGLASAGIIEPEDVVRFMDNEISIEDLLGRL